MLIELRNTLLNTGKNRGSMAYQGFLHIDGCLSGYVSNSGRGEQTSIEAIDDKGAKLIGKAKRHLTSNPDVDIFIPKSCPVAEIPDYSLSAYLDLMALEKLKFATDQQIYMKSCMIWGEPNELFNCFKLPYNIQRFVSAPEGVDCLAYVIQKYVLPEMKKGDLFLNTNIPKAVIDKVGAKYFHPSVLDKLSKFVAPKPYRKFGLF